RDEVRIFAELQERHLGAEFAVFLHVPARLAHQPNRCGIHGLPTAGLHKPRIIPRGCRRILALFGARRLRMRDVGRHNLLRESLALSLGERVSHTFGWTPPVPKSKILPSPLGRGCPVTALSPAAAGGVRGWFRSQ